MPIECRTTIRAISQDEFHSIDRLVTRHAFDIHNSMGRFFNEKIYQNELARRCRDSGLRVEDEVQVVVWHGGFHKDYYLDLLIEGGSLYELKAAEKLVPVHEKQAIGYLHLVGVNHGKLLNFRSSSVEFRFVSTTYTRKQRHIIQMDDSAWHAVGDSCPLLKKSIVEVVRDWGALLDVDLYRAAVLSLVDGASIQEVPISVGGVVQGIQQMITLSDDIAVHVSTTRQPIPYLMHMQRLLKHTPIKSIQWINLNLTNLTMKTLSQ